MPLSKGSRAANLAQPYDFSFIEEAETHASSTPAVSSRQLDSRVDSGHRITNEVLLRCANWLITHVSVSAQDSLHLCQVGNCCISWENVTCWAQLPKHSKEI